MALEFAYSLDGYASSAVKDMPLTATATYNASAGTNAPKKGDAVSFVGGTGSTAGFVIRTKSSDTKSIGIIEGFEFGGLGQGGSYAATSASGTNESQGAQLLGVQATAVGATGVVTLSAATNIAAGTVIYFGTALGSLTANTPYYVSSGAANGTSITVTALSAPETALSGVTTASSQTIAVYAALNPKFPFGVAKVRVESDSVYRIPVNQAGTIKTATQAHVGQSFQLVLDSAGDQTLNLNATANGTFKVVDVSKDGKTAYVIISSNASF
jgi:hypothetical protein